MTATNLFTAFLLAIISSMLINNVVLSRFYGICSYLGVSTKVKSSAGMGVAVVFVIMLASLVCYPIYHFVLVPADLSFLDTIVYILVIASLVQLVALVIKKYSPSLYKSLGIYLPLITTNCAVLGVVQENNALSFASSMANAIGTSLGFLVMIVLFSTIRARLDSYDSPKAWKGLPLALITAAIMAMAIMGLSGMIA